LLYLLKYYKDIRGDCSDMTEKNQKPKKSGFVDKLKKAVLGCGGECGEGCSGCSSGIRIVSMKDVETDEKE